MLKRKKDNRRQASKVERIIDILLDRGNVPQEDLDQIRRWFADSGRTDEKNEAFGKRFSEAFKYESNPRYMPQMWAQIAQRLGFDTEKNISRPATMTVTKGNRVSLRRMVAIRAAAVVIPFLITVTVAGLLILKTGDRTSVPVAGMVTVSVPDNQDLRSYILPDNSVIRLSPDSELRYAEDFASMREVEMEGVVFFDAAHDPQHPFRVHAGGIEVTVHGTNFNIEAQSGSDRIVVELYEGSISVGMPDKRNERLIPGQRLIYSRSSGEYEIETHDSSLPAWISAELSFEHAPITEVLQALEWYYDTPIETEGRFDDKVLFTFRYDGNEGLETSLALLARISRNLTFSMEGDTVSIKAIK